MSSQFLPGPDFILERGTRPKHLFVYRKDRLLVRERRGLTVPVGPDDLPLSSIALDDRLALGQIDGESCEAFRWPEDHSLPPPWQFEGLRTLFGRLDDAAMAAAGYGLQILRWGDAHRFCGRCGGATGWCVGERARQCAVCGQVLFPPVAPAVIVAVISEKRLLLARSGRFSDHMFSVIAGYVEPGETLEECVQREVREEVGLEIGDIRYFGSQPWPFSGSLMVGFTAVHVGGTITVDHKEILEADWFSAANLPQIPGKISIARQLIDWYVERYGPAWS